MNSKKMLYELIQLGEPVRACFDSKFKEQLAGLIKKFSKSKDVETTSTLKSEILQHPYLQEDPWQAAAHCHTLERHEKCCSLLESLRHRLGAGEISYEGIQGATGQPHLTIDKLSGRSVPLLDIAPKWLLLEVPRHPSGGSQAVLLQYWLYSQERRLLILLSERPTVIDQSIHSPMLQSEDGTWRCGTDLRDSFVELIRTRLGDEAATRIQNFIRPNPPLLAGVSPQIAAECQSYTSFDFLSEEKRRTAELDARLTKKFGHRPMSTGSGYTLRPRMRLHLTKGPKPLGQ